MDFLQIFNINLKGLNPIHNLSADKVYFKYAMYDWLVQLYALFNFVYLFEILKMNWLNGI